MKKSDSLNEFWLKKADELGTPILGKLLGHVIRGNKKMPLWGLFYTTKYALYFQTFKTTNWFSILTGGRRNEDNQDQTIEIRANCIHVFRVQPVKKSTLPFLYKPEIIELSWTPDNSQEQSMIIETDSDAAGFVATMELEKTAVPENNTSLRKK